MEDNLPSPSKVYKLLKKEGIKIYGYNQRNLFLLLNIYKPVNDLSIDIYDLIGFDDEEIIDYVKNKILNYNINKRIKSTENIEDTEEKTNITIEERKKNIRKNLQGK